MRFLLPTLAICRKTEEMQQPPPGRAPYGHSPQGQQGYGYGHAPHGHSVPLGHPAPPARFVSGVPLEPGERVIYFRSVAQWGGRIFRIVAGIALAPFIVGLVILYAVFKDMAGEPDAQAITTKRLLAMKSGGKIIAQVRWEEVAGFTKMLRSRADMTMAVRNAQGPQIEFAEDGRWLEQALPAWQRPENREASPEVPFV